MSYLLSILQKLVPPTILYVLLSNSRSETKNKKMKLIPKRFSRSSSSLSNSNGVEEVHWELRPGGMLVQKRDYSNRSSICEDIIKLRVSTTSTSHDISIEATSTFGELKMILSLVTNLKPKEQRLLFKGKEREDGDYLHMVGVGNMDKVLLLEDPAITEKKLHASATRKSYSYY